MRNEREGSVRADLLQDVAIDIDNEIPLLARKLNWINTGREHFPSACSARAWVKTIWKRSLDLVQVTLMVEPAQN